MIRTMLDNSAILPAMLPLLAQAASPQSPDAVGSWLLTLACLLGIALVALQIWERLFPKESPPAAEKYATKAQLAQLEREHEQSLDKLRKELTEHVARIEKRFEGWLTDTEETQSHQNELFIGWQQGIERVIGRLEAAASSRNPRGQKQ